MAAGGHRERLRPIPAARLHSLMPHRSEVRAQEGRPRFAPHPPHPLFLASWPSRPATNAVRALVPKSGPWLRKLAGTQLNWWRAFLTAPVIAQGTAYVDNPIRRLFAPRADQRYAVHKNVVGVPERVQLYVAAEIKTVGVAIILAASIGM